MGKQKQFFMRKQFLLAAALTAGVTFGAAAQTSIQFGARAGFNIDNMSDYDSKVGFHLGGVVDVPLHTYAPALPKWLHAQTGLFLTTKGGTEETNLFGTSVRQTVSLYYLEMPIQASAKCPLTNNVNLRVNFGPSLGLALSGKWKMSGGGQSQNADIFDNDDASRFRFGLDFGAGIEYKQLYFGLGYDLGLTDVTGGNNDSKVSTLGISVGYNF
jgi:hypothetical protein